MPAPVFKTGEGFGNRLLVGSIPMHSRQLRNLFIDTNPYQTMGRVQLYSITDDEKPSGCQILCQISTGMCQIFPLYCGQISTIRERRNHGAQGNSWN